jgi:hypothetical protein
MYTYLYIYVGIFIKIKYTSYCIGCHWRLGALVVFVFADCCVERRDSAILGGQAKEEASEALTDVSHFGSHVGSLVLAQQFLLMLSSGGARMPQTHTYADVCLRMLTYADVHHNEVRGCLRLIRMLTYADVC